MDDELRKFYNSVAWKRKRSWILMRDSFMCQACRGEGRTRPAEVVHHIQTAESCPELRLTDSNLVSLCAECHERIHGRAPGGKRIEQKTPTGVRVLKP